MYCMAVYNHYIQRDIELGGFYDQILECLMRASGARARYISDEFGARVIYMLSDRTPSMGDLTQLLSG